MTPATKHLIEMFEGAKKRNLDQLERVRALPGFRMMQITATGEVDVTDEYKHRLHIAVDEWQRAIDNMRTYDP